MDEGADNPGEDGGIDGGYGGPAPGAGLVLDGRDGGDAGEIDEDEEQEAVGGQRGEVVGEGC